MAIVCYSVFSSKNGHHVAPRSNNSRLDKLHGISRSMGALWLDFHHQFHVYGIVASFKVIIIVFAGLQCDLAILTLTQTNLKNQFSLILIAHLHFLLFLFVLIMPSGRVCQYNGCGRNSRNHPDLSMFSFPRDSNIGRQWILNSGKFINTYWIIIDLIN